MRIALLAKLFKANIRALPDMLLLLDNAQALMHMHELLQGWRYQGGGPRRLCPLPKNGNKGKKGKSFKAETIKRLSPRSKPYCFSHSRASRIQFFSSRPAMVADNTFQCSVAPPLSNPFRRPCTDLFCRKDSLKACFMALKHSSFYLDG